MTDEELKIREILLSGEEAVSPHVWEGVAKGLDKKAGVVRLRWRAAAVFAAAAAVAALAIILPGVVKTAPEQGAVAVVEVPAVQVVPDVPEVTGVPEDVTETVPKAPVKSASARISTSAEDSAPVTASSPVTETTATEAPVDNTPAASIPAASTPATAPASASTPVPAAANRPDPFAVLLAKLEKPELRKPAAITFGGLTQAGAMSRQMAAVPVFAAPSAPVTGIKEAGEESFLMPISLGVGFRFPIVPRLSIGTGLSYTMLGRTFTGTYTEVEDGLVKRQIAGASITEMQHYIGIPVNVYYDVASGSKFSASIFCGAEIERCLANNFRIPYSDGSVNYRRTPDGFQPSVAAGFGLQYNIVPSFGLYAEPSVRYYFDAHQPRSIRTMQPWMITLEAGVRYNFKQ